MTRGTGMISIDPADQSERENYKLLIGSIVPRPIAWTTTLSASGIVNAAPFSYFNIVTASPPLISISVVRRKGEMKDTSRNASQTGEFVVHIIDESNVGMANKTAAQLGPDESEIDYAGLTLVPSDRVRVPGIAEARIRMECTLEKIIPLGEQGETLAPSCDLLIGRVVRFHFSDELYQDGRIDAGKLLPVSRLAGNSYSKLGEIFDLPRP